MTTSSSTNFELDVAEYIEEAFERCGLEVRTGYDLQTAKRSMNILFADWANRGVHFGHRFNRRIKCCHKKGLN